MTSVIWQLSRARFGLVVNAHSLVRRLRNEAWFGCGGSLSPYSSGWLMRSALGLLFRLTPSLHVVSGGVFSRTLGLGAALCVCVFLLFSKVRLWECLPQTTPCFIMKHKSIYTMKTNLLWLHLHNHTHSSLDISMLILDPL